MFSCILKWTLTHSLFFGKIAKITRRYFSHQHIGEELDILNENPLPRWSGIGMSRP